MAIIHGKKGTTARGDSGPPKSIAAKYRADSSEDLPESKGKEKEGGKWGEKHAERAKKKTMSERIERKKKKAKLRKSLEEYLISRGHRGAGCLVVDDQGRMLLGKRTDTGQWSTPGGHVEQDESFEEGAVRELREEANLVAKDPVEITSGMYRGYDSKTFLVQSYKGKIKDNGEMANLKWFEPHELPWEEMTDYCQDAVVAAIKSKLQKSNSLKYMICEEDLQKNIIRSGANTPQNTIYEVTHGDALRLVGNGTFRMLRDAVKDMGDEDMRELSVDNYKISIRKHVNDVYSGRITDGHKQVHQFTNKSLPAVAAELMSVFEWYLPEDESELEIVDDADLNDDVIEGGMNELVDKYRKHNIANIYSEMENIREEMRHGMAVDLQQVEQRMMKLFDRLENTLMDVVDKHNVLNSDAGEAIDMLEQKLLSLQDSIDKLSKQPVTMQAYSSNPSDGGKVHEDYYPYLSRPQVNISPSGHISISFGGDWTSMERENFLKDMKVKAVKKARK